MGSTSYRAVVGILDDIRYIIVSRKCILGEGIRPKDANSYVAMACMSADCGWPIIHDRPQNNFAVHPEHALNERASEFAEAFGDVGGKGAGGIVR